MPSRRGSLSAMVQDRDLRPWTAPDGRKGWQARCPGCQGLIQRPGPPPQPNHHGAFKCQTCGRRVVVV